MSARDTIIDRLAVDLVGPFAPDETIDARPSDVYLTGILWPQNTAIPPDQDERLAVAGGDGDSNEETDEASQPPAAQMRRPSTAGISFACASDEASPRVVVEVACGRYEPHSEVKDRWVRTPCVVPPIEIELTPGTHDISLAAVGVDPYWTLLAYFNSLRELGGALVLMQDDVSDTLSLLAARTGTQARQLSEIEELTSRRTQAEIRDMLEKLAVRVDQPGAVDVVLATNMVSVGVDIPRLGLMLVNGQPKTMAEYIQATSRVGRGKVEGLVVTLLNNAKPRDRSHYETFSTWHSMLYRFVEATSATPFASRARDRALHAVLVALVRHLIPEMLEDPMWSDASIDRARGLIELVAARAARIDADERDVRDELGRRLDAWIRRAPEIYWKKKGSRSSSLMQSAEEAAARRATGRVVGQAWPTPNSMRGVEPATPYRLAPGLRNTDVTQ